MTDLTARIASIWRFPIKSFQGQSVEATTLSASGILGDRVFALRSARTGKILSGKDAKLGDRILEFEAGYVGEPEAGGPLPSINATLDGKRFEVGDVAAFSAACSEALGEAVELAYKVGEGEVYESYWPEVEDHPLAGATIDLPLPLAEQGSFADLEPLHLLTTASMAALERHAPESAVHVSRFRPSLLLDTGDAEGFVEHEWTGRLARLGEATLELGGPAPRCIMTTRPQLGLPRDPTILRTLVQENRREMMGMMMPCLGIYAKVASPGRVAVGDRLVLEDV